MIPDELIKLALVGVGTAIGYFYKHYLDTRKEAEARRIADRRDHYRTLVLGLKAITEGQRDKEESLWFEYSFLWLYAPDPLIQSFNKLLSRLQSVGYTPEAAADVANTCPCHAPGPRLSTHGALAIGVSNQSKVEH